MAMQTEWVEYGESQKGFVAWPDHDNACAVVLVVHPWTGLDGFAEEKARDVAKLGYIAFAVDMFGNGLNPATAEDKVNAIAPQIQDRNENRRRLQICLDYAKTIKQNNGVFGGIGFCFGGMTLLEGARAGFDLKAIVAYHALLSQGEGAETSTPIKTACLVCHGDLDPMVPRDQVNDFKEEFTSHRADWELIAYADTFHSFTMPDANDRAHGSEYNASATEKSWKRTIEFFKEQQL